MLSKCDSVLYYLLINPPHTTSWSTYSPSCIFSLCFTLLTSCRAVVVGWTWNNLHKIHVHIIIFSLCFTLLTSCRAVVVGWTWYEPVGEWDWLFNVTCNNISVIYVTAHRCAGRLKKKLNLRPGSRCHRHFVGFFNVTAQALTWGHPFYGYSKKLPCLVAFYDTLWIRRTYSHLKPSGSQQGLNLKQEAQRAIYRAPEYNMPPFWGIGQGRLFCFTDRPEKHKLRRGSCFQSSFVEFRSAVLEEKSKMSQPIRVRGGHPVFPIGPKNTNLVEDVEILLPVKFGWFPFSGFGGEAENVSANQRPGRPSCFSNPPEKTQT